jgi:hypothetical protein
LLILQITKPRFNHRVLASTAGLKPAHRRSNSMPFGCPLSYQYHHAYRRNTEDKLRVFAMELHSEWKQSPR